jgi:hypothetical protein
MGKAKGDHLAVPPFILPDGNVTAPIGDLLPL